MLSPAVDFIRCLPSGAGSDEVASRQVIDHILRLLRYDTYLSSKKCPTLLDNACGPGFATEALIKAYPEAHIYTADISPGMLSIVRYTVKANNWIDKVTVSQMDGVNLYYGNENFDASVTNFGISFFSDPVQGAKELYRTLKVGGKAVVTCWVDLPFLPILHAVQAIIKPGSKPFSLSQLEEWDDPETMKNVLWDGGFEHVQMHQEKVMWQNKGIDVAAKGLAGNFLALVGNQWSDEEKGEMLEATEKVLREPRQKFLIEKDGMVGFEMTAWIAVATIQPTN